ncbi:hypothetical protein BD408DRAFT_415235 [Parasitella parasitica]|nr:hypothetical protein BD408DRAFT_415235 [Parasitella parasitica]
MAGASSRITPYAMEFPIIERATVFPLKFKPGVFQSYLFIRIEFSSEFVIKRLLTTDTSTFTSNRLLTGGI